MFNGAIFVLFDEENRAERQNNDLRTMRRVLRDNCNPLELPEAT